MEIIREWLVADLSAPRKQRHTARRVWERLVDEYGATVAEATVRACVARLRRELESGRPIPQLHPPGEEAEVDFGEVSVWLAGVETVLPMFVRGSRTRGAVHVCFAGEGQEAFLEGHTVALDRLGGVPRRIRYDNLSSAVTRVLRGRARVESDRFVALRSHYGPTASSASPASRARMRRAAWRARSAASAGATSCRSRAWRAWPLNALLEAADRSDDARHIAGRLATVGAMAEAERPSLRPLPAEPFEAAVPLRAKADRKARISVRGSRYSVPAAYAGRTVEVRLGGGTITALAGGTVIARHERSAHRGAEILVLDHFLEVLSRKPGALPGAVALEQARASGSFSAAHERFWKRTRRKLGDREGTRALIEVLLLHRSLPFVAVHAALDAVERIASVDPALVAIEARRIADGGRERAVVERPALRRFDRPAPALAGYDALLAGSAR